MPFDVLRAELFYPTRSDICQTELLVRQLTEKAATAFLVEFRDESKATHTYLSSLGGKYSMATISDNQLTAGLNKELQLVPTEPKTL